MGVAYGGGLCENGVKKAKFGVFLGLFLRSGSDFVPELRGMFTRGPAQTAPLIG